MMKKMKLFQKTFLYMLLMFGVVIAIIHICVYLFLPHFYIRDIKERLDMQRVQLESVLQELEADSIPGVLQKYAEKRGMNILAEVDGSSFSFQSGAIQIETFWEEYENIQLKEVENAESILISRGKVDSKDGKPVELQLMESTTPVKDAVQVTLTLLPATIILSFVLSLFFAYFYSRKITKPILDMVEVTGKMQQLSKNACFQIQTQDEIGILAAQINGVYEHLWNTIQSLEEEKRYIAEMEKQKVDFLRAASHELKTPLATLRILLENMQYNVGKYKQHDIYLPQGIQEIDRLSKMVQEILDTSRVQSQNKKENLSLGRELEKLAADYQVQMKAAELTLSMDIPASVSVEMDKTVFQKVFRNIMGNAVSYSTRGGEICIYTEGQLLKIENTCVPMPKEQLSHVFEAFYRPDFARNRNDGGNGLGLYIVKELLELNHIPHTFETCERGMCFSMDLKEIWRTEAF